MADKNPIQLEIYPHPPIAYGRLNVRVVNNGDTALPLRLCHWRGTSASSYVLDYYNLGTLDVGDYVVFPIDPSKIEPDKYHLFYVQETSSGTYEYVSNLIRVYVSSSPKITVIGRDVFTGKDIPIEGAYVNVYRLPWEVPATYLTDANGQVVLPTKRGNDKMLLEVFKKTPYGMYYYIEVWDGSSKTIKPEFASAFLVDVEYKIDDWGKLIDRLCAGQTGTAQILKNYFKTLDPNKESDRYYAQQTILALLWDNMPKEMKARWENYVVRVKVDFANKKIYMTFKVGSAAAVFAILALFLLGVELGYIWGRSAGDVEKAQAMADIWKNAQEITKLIDELEKQGLLTPEEAKKYLDELMKLLSESQSKIQPDTTSSLMGTVAAILPLLIVVMLIKAITGVMKR